MLIVVGLAVFVDILAGKDDPALSLLPAVITALGALIVGLSPGLLRALGKRGEQIKAETRRGRVARPWVRGSKRWLTASTRPRRCCATTASASSSAR